VEFATCELFLPAFTLNLSLGGLFILTPSPFPCGETLTLQFRVEELNLSIQVIGHVAWTTRTPPNSGGRRHPPGMGFAFDWVHPGLQSVLDQYVMVSSGLASADPRIGVELPLEVRRELPVPEPEEMDDDTVKYLVSPEELPI
jgi:Tfp pilus assembly protein PilZ